MDELLAKIERALQDWGKDNERRALEEAAKALRGHQEYGQIQQALDLVHEGTRQQRLRLGR